MKPRILLSHNKSSYYADAVNAAGAIADPVFIPEQLNEYDGLLICGGADISPSRYGEEINGALDIDTERDNYEFDLMQKFLEAGKPILGICRGYQLINIFFGGSLIQHIPTANDHRGEGDAVHTVDSADGSVLTAIYGSHFSVNSSHHQAINRLGDGLRLVQISDTDGVAEGIEHTSLPIIGVQWHPERTTLTRARPDTVDGLKLFEYFVRLCEKQAKK